MARGILAFVVACGLFLAVAPPASGAVTVSIRVSDATVDEGDRVTFSGTPTGARLGSTVRLQRRVGDTWQSVASRILRTPRSYAFTVTPPRGRPVYRVLKPRALGQPAAASVALRITVRWQPTLVASAASFLDDQQRSVVRITLRHTGLGGVTLRERRQVSVDDSGSGSPRGRTRAAPWCCRPPVRRASTVSVSRVEPSSPTTPPPPASARPSRRLPSP